VILSVRQAERSAHHNRMGGITPPYWAPTSEEIARLEGQLKPYLEGVATLGAKAAIAKLENSKRQYLGYTDADKKWVFVNSICEASWKRHGFWYDDIIIVFDGGPCFFNVRYDLSSAQFDQLQINGPWRHEWGAR
jgi:hypothetical protein